MKREEIIKIKAKKYLKSHGLSESIIVGKTLKGRNINQFEKMELELGTLSNFKLKKV